MKKGEKKGREVKRERKRSREEGRQDITNPHSRARRGKRRGTVGNGNTPVARHTGGDARSTLSANLKKQA